MIFDINNCSVKILLVTSDFHLANSISNHLKLIKNLQFEIKIANNSITMLNTIVKTPIDLIILDINKSQENWNNIAINSSELNIPVIILVDKDDEYNALLLTKSDVDGYIIKEEISPTIIGITIRFTIERFSLKKTFKEMALIDEITGFYTRKILIKIAEHQLELAKRNKKGLLFFNINLDWKIKLDNSKSQVKNKINQNISTILKNTFRKTDILGVFDDDNLVAIAVEAMDSSSGNILNRLRDNLKLPQQEYKEVCQISTGVAIFDPEFPCSIFDLAQIAMSYRL
ncbi:MAG: hypothetical protein A2086_08775 [Spirochaetes bacterium GWD1_27_9]|nr:MAG: hypothetical protein A2Z98_07630 [Spirochaetes bacterium GWB1_27_13]OHD38637.1 MAG: hypothetical protein A2086_08775 [Spirochaetes bacterium GWD1_27_9]